MKITQEHYEAMREAMRPLGMVIPDHRQWLYGQPKVKDVEKRLRWDLLYASRYDGVKDLYTYLNDDHIDTALRKIVAEITP